MISLPGTAAIAPPSTLDTSKIKGQGTSHAIDTKEGIKVIRYNEFTYL